MTDFTYTVIKRPKKFETGRTDISWAAECGREAVPLGGYLITARTPNGVKRQYTAIMLQGSESVSVGNHFETRAQAAFAIWRKYYEDWRDEKAKKREADEMTRRFRMEERGRRRAYRQTPEGQEAYRKELNRKARERRAAMTPEERAAEASKRRAKREEKVFADTYCGT